LGDLNTSFYDGALNDYELNDQKAGGDYEDSESEDELQKVIEYFS
jgi:hypothetical protein